MLIYASACGYSCLAMSYAMHALKMLPQMIISTAVVQLAKHTPPYPKQSSQGSVLYNNIQFRVIA